jgi:hypothetical protein
MSLKPRWLRTMLLGVVGWGGCMSEELGPPTCGPYPLQASSPYVLPYEVGQAFEIGEGNCSGGSHNAASLVAHAYDFLMPIGAAVIASRAGIVVALQEGFADGTLVPGQENFLYVLHDDATIAAYVHLMQNSVEVAVGDPVVRGQRIATSGNSGTTAGPRLHYHVLQCLGCASIPVVFLNTRAHPNGLQVGETYQADAFQR